MEGLTIWKSFVVGVNKQWNFQNNKIGLHIGGTVLIIPIAVKLTRKFHKFGIKKYIDYVVEKYGKDFTKLYE